MSSRSLMRTCLALGVLGAGNARAAETAPVAADETPVMRQERERGFLFFPSRRSLHGVRIGVGAFYDAIDPAVMSGYAVRLPQLTVDGRYGLKDGWSLSGHLNSMLMTSELLVGLSHTWRIDRWTLEAAANVGLYVGTLHQLAFDALLLSPEYRPELAAGYDFGSIAVSLRASAILMGPIGVDVGGVSGGLDGASLFTGHSEMLYVENTTSGSGIWYFGAGALTTRSYYAVWALFPDSPAFYTYPRIAAGYGF